MLVLLAVLCASGFTVGPAAAEQRLSRAEARAYAIDLLKAQQPAAARAIALALLRADRTDFPALMILAQAENRLGRFKQGEAAARRAWRSGANPEQKFAAAYALSQSLAAQKRFGASQWWLRRAGQAADRPGLDNAARRQYARVRALNPWTTQLGFSLNPSSNINSGPTSNIYTIGGYVFVDPTAVPLSGLEIGSRFSIRRDIRPDRKDGPRFHFGLAYDDRRYTLSAASRRALPTASAAAYAFSQVDLFAGVALPDASGPGVTDARLTLGRNWRGGNPLSGYARLELGRSTVLGGRTRIGYGLSYEDQTRHDSALRSARILTLNGSWNRKLASGGLLGLSLSLADTGSASSEIDHKSVSASLRYVHPEPILGAVPTLRLGLVGRNYDRLRYGASPRRDRTAILAGELFFTRFDYYGFAPTLGATYSRNRSNVSIFDYEEFGVSVGFRSTF
jgi:hypothetical protein